MKPADEDGFGGMPLIVSWMPHFSYEAIFSLFQARQAVYLMMSMGVLNTLFNLITLIVAIAYGLPPWPETTYGYGYTLFCLNWVTGILCVVAGTWRNRTLLFSTAIILSIQSLVNLVVALVQIIGGMSGLINLNTTPNMFGAVVSVISVIFSLLTVTGAWVLYRLIAILRPLQPRTDLKRNFRYF
jgi:hypothetical protein